MQEEQQNYGTQRIGEATRVTESTAPAATGPVGISSGEERTWSVVAHLSIFANLFTPFLGPVVALVIWLVYRDRSERVAWLVVLSLGWVTTGVLTLVLIGFLLIPFMLVLTLVPLVHAAYAAYKVGGNEEYRYPLVADLVQGR